MSDEENTTTKIGIPAASLAAHGIVGSRHVPQIEPELGKRIKDRVLNECG